jgi:hypothetical protein
MARELLTSWSDFQTGLDRLLAIAEEEILVYDKDLTLVKMEGLPRLEHLKRLLQPQRADRIRIALQDFSMVQRNNPRLMHLLADHSMGMTVVETPGHLGHLRDSLIIADGRHGLVLFDRSQPRSKLLLHEKDEVEPYRRRFEEIWAEGGTRLAATTLGL